MQKFFELMTKGEGTVVGDIGRLLMRLVFGGFMAFGHGLGKLQSWSEKADTFSDPLGVGSPTSLALAIFGELVCGILLALGFMHRLVLIPLMFTMFVAGFIVHGADPFKRKELALIYLAGFVVLFFLGPGRYSLDYLLGKKLSSKQG